jgi:hypothetical protein
MCRNLSRGSKKLFAGGAGDLARRGVGPRAIGRCSNGWRPDQLDPCRPDERHPSDTTIGLGNGSCEAVGSLLEIDCSARRTPLRRGAARRHSRSIRRPGACAAARGARGFPRSIDELGKRIGLSRSALHERFVELVGQPAFARAFERLSWARRGSLAARVERLAGVPSIIHHVRTGYVIGLLRA